MRRRSEGLGLMGVMCLAIATAGCAGEPPSISSFTLQPDTVAAGESTQVNGGLDFSDPDGDVEELFFSLALGDEEPGQASQDVPGASDLIEGRLAFILMLQPPTAGDIAVEVWLVDADGNESNSLRATVTAE